jgi:hypothetical protein
MVKAGSHLVPEACMIMRAAEHNHSANQFKKAFARVFDIRGEMRLNHQPSKDDVMKLDLVFSPSALWSALIMIVVDCTQQVSCGLDYTAGIGRLQFCGTVGRACKLGMLHLRHCEATNKCAWHMRHVPLQGHARVPASCPASTLSICPTQQHPVSGLSLGPNSAGACCRHGDGLLQLRTSVMCEPRNHVPFNFEMAPVTGTSHAQS